MVADLEPTPTLSWKDKLLGNMVKSTINGIPTINFSDRVKDILFKEMEKTVVLKLLG
ncbi:hypothetical protein Gorai_016793 [Gossypium raimondii]|uniref:Uncharacterized protein n=1 Tax=Gossypium raimondii TaxID=29730 RepID=A0A7J8PA05_GOSRA|nr:hypothetical protein [Gossypium raimondii]